MTEDLLAWYETHRRRHLPWREEPSPYTTWLSEIMLQQTRVETVIPYFERFVEAFPTVADLAAADEDMVLSLWSGLGYYSRARNLHNAAKLVAAQGSFPSSVSALRVLPGVGPYTAGAIASMAFGLDEVAVDGNVIRVISRLFCLEPKAVEQQTQAILPSGRAGDFNQALMDLGSGVCTPKTPACLTCPLRRHCKAHQQGMVELYPPKKKKKAVPQLHLVALWWQQQDKVLLGKRPRSGLFGGLYELPSGERPIDETPNDAGRRIAREVLGLEGQSKDTLPVVRHTLTHRRLWVTPVVVECVGEPVPGPYERLKWCRVDEVGEIGVATLTRKVVSTAISHSFAYKL